jgi:hypothetical protein
VPQQVTAVVTGSSERAWLAARRFALVGEPASRARDRNSASVYPFWGRDLPATPIGASMTFRRALLFVSFLAACALVGCTTGIGYTFYKPRDGALPRAISNGTFEVTVTECMGFTRSADYFLRVTVRNLGPATALFDSADLELTDLDTKLTYFSVSKDSANVTLPESQQGTILRRTLTAGQGTSGVLWFVTGQNSGTLSKRLKLTYGKGVLEFQD